MVNEAPPNLPKWEGTKLKGRKKTKIITTITPNLLIASPLWGEIKRGA